MSKIQILVACHKESYVPESSIIHSIQVGAALSETKLPVSYYDDQGVHISEKNKSYCELTAQYWAWKNLQAEYYGFFHYRRYLSFAKEYPVRENGSLSCRRWRPYMECGDIKSGLRACALSEEKITALTRKYDIITALREPMNCTVYEQYCQFHHESDLRRMLAILYKRHPKYRRAAKAYMCSKQLYFTNMYLMSRKEFFSYMEWLFPMLEEFEARSDFSAYNEHECRVIGFLAERLFGVYFTYAILERKKRCCELQYVIFAKTNPWERIRPVWKENVVQIAMTVGDRFVPYLAASIESILEHASAHRYYDIVILYTKVTAENRQRLAAMGRKNVSIRFCNISDFIMGISFHVHGHFSEETFYRYFLLDVMEGYSKVLYLDADMIIMRDVAQLYDTPIDGLFLAAARDIDVIGLCRVQEDMKQYVQKTLGIKAVENYFQAGVQLLNLKELRNVYSSADFVDKTLQAKWRLLDQDVMNMMCRGNVKYLPQTWNVLMDWRYCGRSRMDILCQAPACLYQEYLRARKDPSIIHYAGTWKPWADPMCDFSAEFWRCAKKTDFYEAILYENAAKMHRQRKSILEGDNHIRIFRLRPTKIEVPVDMKKVNGLLPPGSRRRIAVRHLFRKFL